MKNEYLDFVKRHGKIPIIIGMVGLFVYFVLITSNLPFLEWYNLITSFAFTPPAFPIILTFFVLPPIIYLPLFWYKNKKDTDLKSLQILIIGLVILSIFYIVAINWRIIIFLIFMVFIFGGFLAFISVGFMNINHKIKWKS
jgi:hypothetical protein